MSDIGLKAPLPVHPQPGFFETTVVVREDGPVLTHHDILTIMARPPWDYEDVQHKITANLSLRGWRRNEHGVFVEPPPQVVPKPRQPQPMKATKVTGINQAKKKPAKKAAPRKKP